MRFLVDVGLDGGGWLEVLNGKFVLRESHNRSSTSQLEADAHFNALTGHRAEGEWLGLAPLRMLSLHLQTAGAETEIVAGGAVLQVQGDAVPRHRVAWVVDKATSPTLGSSPRGTPASVLSV